MSMVSFYSPATGLFTGESYAGADPAANCAPGHAWVEGVFDALSQRVELRPDDFGNAVVPVVVSYLPPPPISTEWVTWEWSAERRRWVEVPTLAAMKRAHSAPLLQQLAQLDTKVARPAGEIAEALALGQPAPAVEVQRLRAINAEKAGLRQQLATIAAWTAPPG